MGVNDPLDGPLQLHDSLRHRPLGYQGEEKGNGMSTL